MRFALVHRQATPDETAFLDTLGEVAVSAAMRSMARLPDGSDQSLVEVKAVDGAYPLYGALRDGRRRSPHDALFGRQGRRLRRRGRRSSCSTALGPEGRRHGACSATDGSRSARVIDDEPDACLGRLRLRAAPS